MSVLENIYQTYARSLTELNELKIIVDGGDSRTDMKNIYVGPPAIELKDFFEEYLYQKSTVAHECGHLLYTPKEALKQLNNIFEKYIYNALEDVRIERALGNRYPGLAALFALQKKLYFERRKNWGNSPFIKKTFGIFWIGSYGKLPPALESDPEVVEFVRENLQLIEKATTAEDPMITLKIAKELADKANPNMNDLVEAEQISINIPATGRPQKAEIKQDTRMYKVQLPAPAPTNEENQTPEESQPKEENLPSNQQQEAESQNFQPSSQPEETQEPDEPEADDNSGSSKAEETEPAKEESNHLAGSNTETSNQEELEEENKIPADEGTENEELEETTEEVEAEEEKQEEPGYPNTTGEEQGTEPKTEEEANKEVQETSFNEEEFNYPETEKEEFREPEEPEMNEEDEEFPTDEPAEEEIDEISEEELKEALENLKEELSDERKAEIEEEKEIEGETNFDPQAIEEALKALKAEANAVYKKVQMERKNKPDYNRLNQQMKTWVKEELWQKRPIHKKHEAEFYTLRPEPALYKRIVQRNQKQIRELTTSIKRAIEARKALLERGKKYGRLDKSSIWKVGVKELNLFSRKNNPRQEKVAFYLLVDCSGSMGITVSGTEKNRMEIAREAATVFAEALKALNIPFAVTGYSSGSKCNFYRTVRFGYYDEDLPRIVNLTSGYGSRHGFFIQVAAKELSLRQEEKKFLIVITDGLPEDDAEYNRYGYRDVAEAVTDAEKMGVKVINLFIGNERDAKEIKKIFKHTINLHQPEFLPKVLGNLLAKLI
ncbi:VWA domain-containing protein [Carboxydothermus ferrireducens]|uniref:VWFA domain-containing protein n=1 Tax=Carboxydothermus ferrireducens DSM 11255 TaxID=1119529 RepID=A0ABX2R7P3_9THEO|nr:VWA domain-containing protein [Carboxydothermus ferrireducens]NYE57198.1 hypothetical protein [Carboxydothermus ferrireducens DSM 11255]